MQTVLDLVASTETTTRADVARTTGLTRATVSTIVGELIEEELVVEVGRGVSEGGKPPTLIALNENGRHLIAVDLSVNPFTGRIVNLAGRPVGEGMVADQTGDHQTDLNALIAGLATITDRPVIGVSIASPGVITDDGIVVEASNLGWRKYRLAERTAAATGLPVTVVNDAQAAAVTAYARLVTDLPDGELPPSDLLLIEIGESGVGAGIILGGRIHVGSHRAAGEIGHSVLDPDGHPCHCGNRGCLETVASASAIYTRIAGEQPRPARWDLAEVEREFGSELVEAALTEAGRAIGSTLGILINALDVSLLVIAMQSAEAAASVARAVDGALTQRVLPALRPDLRVTAMNGQDLSLFGAAAVVLNDRFGLSWQIPAAG